MGERGIPLDEYIERWCREHEDRERQKFADMAQRLQDSEQRTQGNLNARFEEHGRQHAMEQSAYNDFRQEMKTAWRDLTAEVISIKLTVARGSAVVGAAIVVAGLVVKFL